MTVSAKQLRSLDYRSSCLGKVRWSTEAEAAGAAESRFLRIALTFGDWELQSYPCQYGRHWHLDHHGYQVYSAW